MKFLFLFIIPFSLIAQIEIILPDTFKVLINEKQIQLEQDWYDSLQYEAEHAKIYYQLAGHHSFNRSAVAKLKIPQTLTVRQVVRQVLFYYSLLNSEKKRKNEKVLIYPLFIDVDGHEYISCNYSDNIYYFYIKKWETIAIPSTPTLEEKFIYNQTIKYAMQNTLLFAEIPEKALKEVSMIQNKSFDEVFQIYKKVVLWNSINN